MRKTRDVLWRMMTHRNSKYHYIGIDVYDCSKLDLFLFAIITIIIGAVGNIGASSESLDNLLKSLGFNNNSQNTLSQLINITTRCTYFIFCCRNKSWTYPDLFEI